MAVITITSTTGRKPDRGRIRFAARNGEVGPRDIRLVAGSGSIELTPGYYWVGEYWAPAGRNFLTLIVSDTDYDDLPTIDPTSLIPTVEPEAAWDVKLADLQAEVDELELGGSGDLGREYTFTNLAVWNVAVPAGILRRPRVTLYDPSGEEIEADIVSTLSTVTITFPGPFSGTAVLN